MPLISSKLIINKCLNNYTCSDSQRIVSLGTQMSQMLSPELLLLHPAQEINKRIMLITESK